MAHTAGGLPLIQELVSHGDYDWSAHVHRCIAGGEFEPADLEACIASGCVTKTERDRDGNSVARKVLVIQRRDPQQQDPPRHQQSRQGSITVIFSLWCKRAISRDRVVQRYSR